MKKYTIKNYRGNIIESIENFQKKYSNVRIVEAAEINKNLVLKCELVTESGNGTAEEVCSGSTNCSHVYALNIDADGEVRVYGANAEKELAKLFISDMDVDKANALAANLWKMRSGDSDLEGNLLGTDEEIAGTWFCLRA